MKENIILWDSDPDFKEALSRTLFGKGFNPLALENPASLAKAMEFQESELLILEGNWQRGAKIDLDCERLQLNHDGELAVILPSFEVSSSGGRQACGIVLENLRKPFGLTELSSGIRSALSLKEHIEKKPEPWEEYLEFRRLETKEEILSALRLRYEVYREVGFIGSSEEEIEIDQYDTRSIILGAYVHHNGSSELIGSIRLIRKNSAGPHKKEIEGIMQQRGIELVPASYSHEATLPAFKTFGITEADYPSFCPGFGTTFSGCGKEVSSEIFELSRLVIRNDHRKHRSGIERKLYELVITDCCAWEPRKNWFAIAVHPSKSSIYSRYGFREIPELGVESYTGISQPAILMAWDLQQYLLFPNPFTKDLDLNTLLYKTNGKLLDCLHEEPEYTEKMAS